MAVRPDTTRERELALAGYRHVVGLDEVGRGALAGPVFAAAVILPREGEHLAELAGCVRDSKQLTPAARERAFRCILGCCRYAGCGAASNEEIDVMGVAAATRLAWMRALEGAPDADFLLIDAFRLPECGLPQLAVVRGDSACLSIAAASIVAKVQRDSFMTAAHEWLPAYGFDRNKGYGTPEHLAALRAHGPSELHRHSFAPVSQMVPV